jgi:glycosyltransferase involved in cell wall biosynthesis
MKVALLTSDTREVVRDYGSSDPSFGTAPQALLEGFALLPDRVEIHVISCLQKKPASSPRKLAENIYYHGLHVPNIGWMKTGYLGCIRAVRCKLKEIRPDIVHGQGTERDCAVCAAFSGFPNVLTIHGVMRVIHQLTQGRESRYYWFAKQLEALALRRSNGVITISPYVESFVSHVSKRTWFIPNALQSFFFEPLTPRGLRSGNPKLINVGVISPRKRQIELLRYLSSLREDVPFDFTFVGKADVSGSYAREFKVLLAETNARHGGFKHREYLEPREFLALYDESDAMVHFSREESFGLTFAEALARNLPLFASDVGAVRQIAEGITDCRIFSAEDFDRLIDSLREWLQAGRYVHDRATKPNELIARRYHPRVIAEQHLEVYQLIVSLHHTQPPIHPCL